MSDTAQFADMEGRRQRRVPTLDRFVVRIGRFDDPADRAVMDRLARWIEDEYHEELKQRPSKHVYLRLLPAAVRAETDRLR